MVCLIHACRTRALLARLAQADAFDFVIHNGDVSYADNRIGSRGKNGVPVSIYNDWMDIFYANISAYAQCPGLDWDRPAFRSRGRRMREATGRVPRVHATEGARQKHTQTEKFYLQDPTYYYYLSISECYTVPGIDDTAWFK